MSPQRNFGISVVGSCVFLFLLMLSTTQCARVADSFLPSALAADEQAPMVAQSSTDEASSSDDGSQTKKSAKDKKKKKKKNDKDSQTCNDSSTAPQDTSTSTESKVPKVDPPPTERSKASIFDEVHKGEKPKKNASSPPKSDDQSSGDHPQKHTKKKPARKSDDDDKTPDKSGARKKPAKAHKSPSHGTKDNSKTRDDKDDGGKPEKIDKSDKKAEPKATKDDTKEDAAIEKADKPEKQDKPDKVEKPDKTDKPDKPGSTKPTFVGGQPPKGPSMSGNASWYGVPFHGRKTASGEVFNMYRCSAAHKTLPLITRVLVEDPRTGNTVMVRVNDRGPYVGTRIMDLSREAARELGTMNRGVYYIEATVLGKE